MRIKLLLSFVLLFWAITGSAYQTVTLDGDNRDYSCSFRTTLIKSIEHPHRFKDYLKNLNLSPDCLDQDQRRFIIKTARKIRGITFGTHASVSKVVSVEGGLELVLVIIDDQTMMAGLVHYEGGGASVSLPVGASITKGVLHGECRSVESYLGNFQTFSLLGMNKSFGTAEELRHPHRTHCDASSNTVGASMSVIGYSMTHYSAASKFYLLKGERVEEMIEFITRYHPLH